MGFSRQAHWRGLPFPSPGDLPDPGIKPGSPALQADALSSEPQIHNFKSRHVPHKIVSHLARWTTAPTPELPAAGAGSDAEGGAPPRRPGRIPGLPQPTFQEQSQTLTKDSQRLAK